MHPNEGASPMNSHCTIHSLGALIVDPIAILSNSSAHPPSKMTKEKLISPSHSSRFYCWRQWHLFCGHDAPQPIRVVGDDAVDAPLDQALHIRFLVHRPWNDA